MMNNLSYYPFLGNESHNFTVDNWETPSNEIVLVVWTCLSAVIVLVNAVVLFTTLSNKIVRQVAYVNVVSLCVSDGMVGLSILSLALASLLMDSSSTHHGVCNAIVGFATIAPGLSTSHLFLICARRCWRTHTIVTLDDSSKTHQRRHSLTIIASTYIGNIVVLSIPFLVWTTPSEDDPLYAACAPPFVFGHNSKVAMGYVYTVYLIPNIAMNVMYAKLVLDLLLFKRQLLLSGYNGTRNRDAMPLRAVTPPPRGWPTKFQKEEAAFEEEAHARISDIHISHPSGDH
jgi:hypothetical protein